MKVSIKKACIYILTLIGIISICTNCLRNNEPTFNYIYTNEDDLLIESFLKDSTPILNFEADNIIYWPGREFVYTYDYVSDLGDTMFIGNDGHSTISASIAHKFATTITKVSFQVDTNLGKKMREMIPEYYQSGLTYNYYNQLGTSILPIEGSGLVENQHNIWIHPFRRQTYFAMLNMNAYPYVKLPLAVGKEWSWQLGIGGEHYLNPIWTNWTENTIRYHHYKVVKKTTMRYNQEDIEIWEIDAKTTGEAGETKSSFYFNQKYGFIRMRYETIMGSQFIFTLTSSLTCRG